MRLWLQTSVLVLALLAVSLMCLRVARLARDLDLSVTMSDEVLGNVNDAAASLKQASANLVTLSGTANTALNAEVTELDVATKQIVKTEDTLRRTIDTSRQTVDDFRLLTLPEVNKTIANINSSVDALQPSLKNMASATESAATRLSDPDLKETMDNLAKSAQNGAEATGYAKDTLLDVRDAFRKEIHDLFAPVSKVYTAAKVAATLIGRLLLF